CHGAGRFANSIRTLFLQVLPRCCPRHEAQRCQHWHQPVWYALGTHPQDGALTASAAAVIIFETLQAAGTCVITGPGCCGAQRKARSDGTWCNCSTTGGHMQPKPLATRSGQGQQDIQGSVSSLCGAPLCRAVPGPRGAPWVGVALSLRRDP